MYTAPKTKELVERGRSVRGEDLLRGRLGDAVREREFEVLLQNLLDVRSSDIVGFGDLYNLQDLQNS